MGRSGQRPVVVCRRPRAQGAEERKGNIGYLQHPGDLERGRGGKTLKEE